MGSTEITGASVAGAASLGVGHRRLAIGGLMAGERARNAHRTCETEPDQTRFLGTGWNGTQIERAIPDAVGRIGQKM